MQQGMRRLLWLVALALLARETVAQSLIASAATRRVQQRVQQILASGGKLSPEALLSKPNKSLTSAAAYSDPVSDHGKQHIGTAAVQGTAAGNIKGEGAAVAAASDDSVTTASQGLKFKWAVKQVGTVTIEEAVDANAQPSLRNEAAALIRRAGAGKLSKEQLKQQLQQLQDKQKELQQRLQHQQPLQTPTEPPTEVEYIEIAPDAQAPAESWQAMHGSQAARMPDASQQVPQASRDVDEERVMGSGNDDAPQSDIRLVITDRQEPGDRGLGAGSNKQQGAIPEQGVSSGGSSSSRTGTAPREEDEQSDQEATETKDAFEREEVIKRLSQVDWKGVFDAAQRDAEAEQREAEARKKAREEARREAQKRHDEQLQQAEAERKKAAEEARKKDAAKDADQSSSKTYEQFNPYEWDRSLASKLVLYEKSRSPLRYFPGGGIYSFTSELTCTTEQEYQDKMSRGAFPMVTPRMLKTTVGMCEWTVAEVSVTPVKHNVFLLGNAWATCTFLPAAEEACGQPLSSGLTLSIQALMYQFAKPKGIKEADASGQSSGTPTLISAPNSMAAGPMSTPATKEAGAVAPTAAAAASVQAAAASQAVKAKAASKGPFLMEVELENVFLGLITGAFGPKKSKFKQGAIQFAFGPPPDSAGKTYAVETHLPPVALGGPSVEELQENLVKLVPGTMQIVFDDE